MKYTLAFHAEGKHISVLIQYFKMLELRINIKGFRTPKSKKSPEGEGNVVHLGLPCGRQKLLEMLSISSQPWAKLLGAIHK